MQKILLDISKLIKELDRDYEKDIEVSWTFQLLRGIFEKEKDRKELHEKIKLLIKYQESKNLESFNSIIKLILKDSTVIEQGYEKNKRECIKAGAVEDAILLEYYRHRESLFQLLLINILEKINIRKSKFEFNPE